MIKVKQLNQSTVTSLPFRAHATDAGLDLVATSVDIDNETGIVTYGTNIAVQLESGQAGLLMPRSSIYKTSLMLANSIGLLDQSYTGELKLKFRRTNFTQPIYEVGDRVAQLVVVQVNLESACFVFELDQTDRGAGGFGHTGA